MEFGREMSIDESFRKPGSIPFKWEIRPGIPKPPQSSTTTTTTTNPLPLPPKLRSRPSMLPLSLSQSSNILCPTAASKPSQTFPSQGCFRIPSLKRRDDKKGVELITLLQRRSTSARLTPLFSSPFGKSTQAKDAIKLETSLPLLE